MRTCLERVGCGFDSHLRYQIINTGVKYATGTGPWKYKLLEPLIIKGVVDVGPKIYEYGDTDGKVWLTIGPHYKLTISAEYAWDGASPKLKVGPFWIGTPDFMCNTRGTCVHDALYQFMHVDHFPYSRKDADTVFYNLMRDDGFKLLGTYHGAVRLFGGVFRNFRNSHTGKLIRVITGDEDLTSALQQLR